MSATTAQPGKVLPYRSQRTYQEWTALLGMAVFVGGWVMMFAALFFVYGGLRSHAEVWPPVEYPELPVVLPGINTVIVAVSSIILVWGMNVAPGARRAALRITIALGVTTILGALFLALQAHVWMELWDQGLKASSGPYGSVFYGLTWVHAAHVAVGVLAMAVLTVRGARGHFEPARMLPVKLWSVYWHFVGAVWAFLYVSVYLG